MKYLIDVISIEILQPKNGTDLVVLKTNLTAPILSCPNEKAYLEVRATKDKGLEWVVENFPGIEPKITKMNH